MLGFLVAKFKKNEPHSTVKYGCFLYLSYAAALHVGFANKLSSLCCVKRPFPLLQRRLSVFLFKWKYKGIFKTQQITL